ncbi:hypothetical protein ACF0H5_005808 [Mactra antiquata]
MMEFKLGSVMLLLSCSLQQSLWGILASMPQTNADRCKKISSDGGQTKRVQMIRRIPARCSSWDEAWSWISNKDCRTKYVMDYVEIPSAVQKIDPADCKQEEDPPTEKGLFNVADEKYLAIAFGSATVALLILIVIIVISVIRRGQNRCRMCGSGPAYSSASASEREHLDSTGGNEYVGDEFKLAEPVYEEIIDGQRVRKRLEMCNDVAPPSYENAMSEEKDIDEVKKLPMNGANHRPVTPSAPFVEDLLQPERTCVPNDYSVLNDKLVNKSNDMVEIVEGATGYDPDQTRVLTVYNAREDEISRGRHSNKDNRNSDNHSKCAISLDISSNGGKDQYPLSNEKSNEPVFELKDKSSADLKSKDNLCVEKSRDTLCKIQDQSLLTNVKSDDNVCELKDQLSPTSLGTVGDPVSDPLVDFEDLVSTKSHSYENLEHKDNEEYATLNQSIKNEISCSSPVDSTADVKNTDSSQSGSNYINAETFTPVTIEASSSKESIQHTRDSDNISLNDGKVTNVDSRV